MVKEYKMVSKVEIVPPKGKKKRSFNELVDGDFSNMKWPVKPNINPVPRTVSLFPAQSVSVAHFLRNQPSNTSTI